MRTFFTRLFACIALFISTSSPLLAEPAHNWQTGFQKPASPIAEGIFAFHDDIRVFIVAIAIFVGYRLFSCIRQFDSEVKGELSHRLTHATTLEIIWTIIPALILVVIALPSFALLYSIDEFVEPLLTVKVIGHQWYWSYEFLDPEVIAKLYNEALGTTTFEAKGSASFDSYRLGQDALAANEGLTSYRLLTVDNHLFLPTEAPVRVVITSADVLHSWCIPSLGVKLDSCPGRLNETSLFIQRDGIYYGQCSEICGVNHGFRPIGIVSHSFLEGVARADVDVEPLLTALQAIARD